MPPTAQSGVLRVDFITPYLSSNDNLPITELDASLDPDGVFQAILRRLEKKFYSEDNKIDYLRMKVEDDIYSYVLDFRLIPVLNPKFTSVELVQPLHIRPGQLVELVVGFLVLLSGKRGSTPQIPSLQGTCPKVSHARHVIDL